MTSVVTNLHPAREHEIAFRLLGSHETLEQTFGEVIVAAMESGNARALDRARAVVLMARTAVGLPEQGGAGVMRLQAIEVARAVERRVRDGNTFTDGRVTEAGAFGADVAAQIAARIAALPGDVGVGC